MKTSLSRFAHTFLCPYYLMTRFYYLSHSFFFFLSPFPSQCKMLNFCHWFLWKAPWTDQRSEMASFLQNNQIVKQGNFAAGIKIFTQNNLVISIVLNLAVVNLLSFLPILSHSRWFFYKWFKFCYFVLYGTNVTYLTPQNSF